MKYAICHWFPWNHSIKSPLKELRGANLIIELFFLPTCSSFMCRIWSCDYLLVQDDVAVCLVLANDVSIVYSLFMLGCNDHHSSEHVTFILDISSGETIPAFCCIIMTNAGLLFHIIPWCIESICDKYSWTWIHCLRRWRLHLRSTSSPLGYKTPNNSLGFVLSYNFGS